MKSPLPPYPNPSPGRRADDGKTDWRLFASRAVIVSVLGLLLAALLIYMALLFTCGQILLIFSWLW